MRSLQQLREEDGCFGHMDVSSRIGCPCRELPCDHFDDFWKEKRRRNTM